MPEKAAVQLTHLSPETQSHTFADVEVVRWPSDDGLMVEGLLLKPPDAAQKAGVAVSTANDTHVGAAAAAAAHPLITFTHCGPAMAVLQTFIGYGSVCARFPLEIWAERGYSVLMPNYRGSTGYGRSFRRADRHDWGGGDYNDVFSGVTHMVKSGQANPAKLAHVGWSYGGYMSALALGKVKSSHGITLQAVCTGECRPAVARRRMPVKPTRVT